MSSQWLGVRANESIMLYYTNMTSHICDIEIKK